MTTTGLIGRAALLAGAALALAPAAANAQAIITTGSGVYGGFLATGEMGYTDGVITSVNGASGTVGISVQADLSAYGRGTGLFDATTPGCICEGWGVSASGFGGGRDQSSGPNTGITLASQATDYTPGVAGTFFTTTSTLDGTSLQDTQAYAASKNPALIQDLVTLTNTGSSALTDVRYRRTMDWDGAPQGFAVNRDHIPRSRGEILHEAKKARLELGRIEPSIGPAENHRCTW